MTYSRAEHKVAAIVKADGSTKVEMVENIYHIIPKYSLAYIGDVFNGSLKDPNVCVSGDNSCWKVTDEEVENLYEEPIESEPEDVGTVDGAGEIPFTPESNP